MKTITIDGTVYVPLNSEGCLEPTPFQTGKSYLIRTVTMILVGKAVSLKGQFLTLIQAAWIADTGRFSECLEHGAEKFNEVEVVQGDVFVGIGSIIDVYEWPHPLPTETK